MSTEKTESTAPTNFIKQIIEEDLRTQKNGSKVATRFPPEPNGYLHIGHAKSICLNFGLARDYSGSCNLRMDDTNPLKEDVEYIESIQEDVKWLGFKWTGPVYFASDYFEKLYSYAELLIGAGKAFVCSLNAEQMRVYRGTLTEAGRASPDRERSAPENLDLFRRMRAGEFPDGHYTLRLKIDMASPNMNMRDPVVYRIRRAHHPRTGDAWCLYPMYDYAHPLSDAIEGITHSVCTLEFADHRPLYDWLIDNLPVPSKPRQYEFSRLNINYTVMSKRRLLELVTGKHVDGWDDPRMPTISGMRRRGYTPAAIRDFAERVGVTKKENCIEMSFLEGCVREDLEKTTPRMLGVLRPLKVVIENYPEGETESFEGPLHPQDPSMGSRQIPFGREIYIEQEDFMETPVKGYFRLAPGTEVRLRYAYFIKCVSVEKDASGRVVLVRCTYDPATRGGSNPPDGRKVKGTIHWVSCEHAVSADVRLYDRLFSAPFPGAGDSNYLEQMNPKSLEVLSGARLEPALMSAGAGDRFQFERNGYFVADAVLSKPGAPVFNRIVTLRDSWAGGAKG